MLKRRSERENSWEKVYVKDTSSKRMLVDPIFAKSAHHCYLQAADLVAYTARRIATKTPRRPSKIDEYF